MSTYIWPPMSGGGGGGGSPTGPAGGDLSGSYPNPLVPATHSSVNTFASYDASGNLGSAPGWHLDPNGQAQGVILSTDGSTSTSLQLFAPISTSLTGGYEGMIVSGIFSSTMTFTSSYNDENNYNSGYNNSGGTSAFQDQSSFNSGAQTQSYQSFASFPVFAAGSIVTDSIQGISLQPTLNGTISASYTGINIGPTGTGTITSATGINIDMASLPVGDPQGPIAINTDTRVSINAAPALQSAQTFQIGNRVEALFTVAPGSPITGTDALGNDFAGDLWAQDSIANGPTGGIVGWTGVGFISELIVAAGKTVDTANIFLSASSLPTPPSGTDGGTITNLSVIKAYPPLPQGGSLNVTNIKALNVAGTFSTAATNAWGLYVEDTALNNHIAGNLETGSFNINDGTSNLLYITQLSGVTTIGTSDVTGSTTPQGLSIISGNSVDGNAFGININSGSTSGTGAPGGVAITGGDAAGASNGGAVVLEAGGSGTGNPGQIQMYSDNGIILLPSVLSQPPFMEFFEGTSNFGVSLSASNALTASYSLKLPLSDGSANSLLKTDGAGQLSFSAPGISVTIVTSRLTPVTGAQGSMTFTNGILTSQTQST